MRLQTIALILVCIAAIGYLTLALTIGISSGPAGLLLLIPLSIGVALMAAVIIQRVNNKDDDHYDRIEK